MDHLAYGGSPKWIIPSSCLFRVLTILLSSFKVSSNLFSSNSVNPATPLSLAFELTGSFERVRPGVSINRSCIGSYCSTAAVTTWEDNLRVGPIGAGTRGSVSVISATVWSTWVIGGPGEVGDEGVSIGETGPARLRALASPFPPEWARRLPRSSWKDPARRLMKLTISWSSHRASWNTYLVFPTFVPPATTMLRVSGNFPLPLPRFFPNVNSVLAALARHLAVSLKLPFPPVP